MKEDNVIPFPKKKVRLSEGEYKQFLEYKEKMMEARTKAEVDYYYSMALSIIEKAKNRYH
ncbi:hypothetical protein JCM9140_1983 [Halalkalibacter wakoensis JCM 9140]|uniref:Uncharacterized protein n=1 Tax=Halalkalibacter wakoensis JCM 9140 TaxID=1236970 RepID=W4Q2M5_9BACI|nr:hypothetical protein [Halalkalibacter wakoensis]GAE25958.1 hypothetical protein JCM9140_1983 [Halalkalibacter wakoensis JCM 9140]